MNFIHETGFAEERRLHAFSMGQVNIRELAKELKLSIGTVSKALKDSYEISAETKQRVQHLARKLDYIPNPYASSLRRKKSNTIAVVIPEVADSFFSLALKGVEEIAQTKGYHVLVYLSHESCEKEKAIMKDFQSGRVDGVLMSVTTESDSYAHVYDLYKSGVPVVFFDRVFEDMPTAKITTDDFDAAYTAARHLVEKGCRKISLLSISKSLSISNRRQQGFQQALVDHGLASTPSAIVQCTNDPEKNYRLIRRILGGTARPDGIIATVENLITPVYKACADLQLSIPGQMKVIAFSNLPTASILNPSLTTVTQPAFEMGKAASAILFKALSKPGFNLQKESTVIPSVLSVRGSTM